MREPWNVRRKGQKQASCPLAAPRRTGGRWIEMDRGTDVGCGPLVGGIHCTAYQPVCVRCVTTGHYWTLIRDTIGHYWSTAHQPVSLLDSQLSPQVLDGLRRWNKGRDADARRSRAGLRSTAAKARADSGISFVYLFLLETLFLLEIFSLFILIRIPFWVALSTLPTGFLGPHSLESQLDMF